MFVQVISMLGGAVHAVYDWFWDFLHDGYGNIAITIVLGMVIFCIIFRYLLLPLIGGSFNVYGIRGGALAMHSDYVSKNREKSHPNFSRSDPFVDYPDYGSVLNYRG